ncbi:MAG: RNA methyltransferase [Flammeovirgaceae bacterium]|nr:RNA methyltransferase [Flammeovirgaceae bacterium]MBE62599.1 RNA methyltransferase [Flammeovirgaceae bacterium]HCX20814.1 RNA methyltransferase [Cytophagales bacterium]|tara:strand:- start:7732 stop:8271 length:540 start_codon:yes stop_codon:yes gene_type:complete
MRKLKNEELGRLEPEEFAEAEKLNACIILDDIRSMNNIGSAFRTSDAFRVEKIYLCGITATPPHRDINKTALGATDTVEWEHVKDIQSLISQLKDQGYKIVSVEQADQSTMLNEFQPTSSDKYAFVFGNEVFGVNDDVVKESDIVLEIPQFGTKHSLNISVSLGITIWDFVSKTEFFDS